MSGKVKQMGLVLGAIVTVAIAPVLSVAAASGIASAYSCKLSEADAHPCVVHGVDIGELLYSMFVMGWFALATVPLGALALVLWTIVAIVTYVQYRKKIAATHV